MLDEERLKLLAKLSSMNETEKLKLLAELQKENHKLKQQHDKLEEELVTKLTQELERQMKDEN